MPAVRRLKKLALHCNFEKLNVALKDQIVCGIQDKETHVRLFEEKNLTFEKALDIATKREAAVLNAVTSSNVLEKNDTKQTVYAVQVNNERRQGSIQGKDQLHRVVRVVQRAIAVVNQTTRVPVPQLQLQPLSK